MKNNVVGAQPKKFNISVAVRALVLALVMIALLVVEVIIISSSAENTACAAAKENYKAAAVQIANRLTVKIDALFDAEEGEFDLVGKLDGGKITVNGTEYSVKNEAERINLLSGTAVIAELSSLVQGSSDGDVYIVIPKIADTAETDGDESDAAAEDGETAEDEEATEEEADETEEDTEENDTATLCFLRLGGIEDELLTGAVSGFAVLSSTGRIVWSDNSALEGYISEYASQLPSGDGVYVGSGSAGTLALSASKLDGEYDYYICVWDDYSAREAEFSSLSLTVALVVGICGIVSIALFLAAALVQLTGEGGRQYVQYHVTTDAGGRIIKANKAFYEDFPKVVEFKENLAYFEEDTYNVVILKNASDEDVTLTCTVQHKAGKIKVNAGVLSLPVGRDIFSAGENMKSVYEAFRDNGERVFVGYAFIGNLDNFKSMFGEDFADHVRKQVCAKLSEKFVFTYENDYHTIGLLCRDGKQLENLMQDLRDIVSYVNKTLPVDGNLVNPNVKFGFALVDASMEDKSFSYAQTAANAALNRATKDSEKAYYVYQEAQKKQYAKYFISYDIPKMLEENQFEMQYQPQYSIKEERIVGFEALFRVKENAVANSNIFELITFAERTGNMILLSEFIFDTGMRFAKSIEGKNVAISLNVSPVQLMQAGFVDNFLKIYQRYDLKPGSICVEITESFLMTTFDETVKKLNLLRDAGIEIHLDDFGTRYSSLLYLKKLPISTIKIDKEFIDDICKNTYSHAVTQMILNISKDIKCSNISEGVETMEQYLTLKEMGGDIVQGYLIGKSMKDKVAAEMIDTFKLTV